MTAWIALALAGGAGSVARLLVARAVTAPLGTLIVNVTGAFALGLLGGDFVLGTGFVGAYTTFSTWMLETDDLAREGRHAAALANVLGSLALGLAAAALGIGVRSHG